MPRSVPWILSTSVILLLIWHWRLGASTFCTFKIQRTNHNNAPDANMICHCRERRWHLCITFTEKLKHNRLAQDPNNMFYFTPPVHILHSRSWLLLFRISDSKAIDNIPTLDMRKTISKNLAHILPTSRILPCTLLRNIGWTLRPTAGGQHTS